MYKVFTYGTLMKGQRNHFYVADSTYLGDAILEGYGLYDTGYEFLEDPGSSSHECDLPSKPFL